MASYQENLRLGVTGPNTNTCFTAAIEMLTTPSLLPSTHIAYDGFTRIEDDLKKRHKASLMSGVFDVIAKDLGFNSHADIGFERVNSSRELSVLLRKLFINGNPVVVDIDAQTDPDILCYNPEDFPHAVGLIPVSTRPEAFSLISTWLPEPVFFTDAIYTSDDLFDWLQFSRDPHIKKYPSNDANVTFLPPEVGDRSLIRRVAKTRAPTASTGPK